MTPLSHTHTELRLVVDRIFAKAMALVTRNEEGPAVTPADLQDHRTEAMGELIDAFDRIEPGLGQTLFGALYPLSSDDPDGAFTEVPR